MELFDSVLIKEYITFKVVQNGGGRGGTLYIWVKVCLLCYQLLHYVHKRRKMIISKNIISR